MFIRRITLLRNRVIGGQTRGIFVSYPGILLAIALIAAAVMPLLGLAYGTSRAVTRRAADTLDFQRQQYLALLERHNQLLDSRTPSTPQSTTRTVDPGYRTLTDEFRAGNFQKALVSADTLLRQGRLDAAAKEDVCLKRALCLVFLQDYSEALQTVKAGLTVFPDSYPLMQLEADLFLRLSDFDAAAPLIDKLVAGHGGPSALFSRANLCWALGRTEDAGRDLEAVLSCGVPLLEKAAAHNLALLYARTADEPRALFYISMLQTLAPVGYRTDFAAGSVYLSLSRYKEAEKRLLDAYHNQPQSADVILELAVLYQKQGKDALAREYMSDAAQADPACANAASPIRGAWIFGLAESAPAGAVRRVNAEERRMRDPGEKAALRAAESAAASGDLKRALDVARDVGRAYPDSAQVKTFQAYLLIQLGRPREAAPLVAEAVTLAPFDPQTLLFAATFANATGDSAAAKAYYLRTLAADAANVNAFRALAVASLAAGRHATALDFAARGLAFAPGDTLLLEAAASAASNLRDYDDALAYCRRLIDAGAESSHVRYLLAGCLREKGAAIADVAAQYEKALALDAANIAAANDYADFLARTGSADKAVAICRTLLAATNRAAFALDTAGFASYKAGRLDEARALLDEALSKDSAHPAVLVHAALLYGKLGLAEKSKSLYETALQKAAGDPRLVSLVKDEFQRG